MQTKSTALQCSSAEANDAGSEVEARYKTILVLLISKAVVVSIHSIKRWPEEHRREKVFTWQITLTFRKGNTFILSFRK